MSSRKKRHGAQNDEDDDVEDDHEEKEGEAQATGARRCYYDVMEVPRTASEDDLKQAYRKLARQWHPGSYIHHIYTYLYGTLPSLRFFFLLFFVVLFCSLAFFFGELVRQAWYSYSVIIW
jgi:hypothetical protein